MNLRQRISDSLSLHNFGHAYNDIYFVIIPLLLPLLKSEFGLNYTQSGLLVTGHIGMRSLFSYIFGHLGDNYDKRVIISAGFIISSLFMAGLVWAGNILVVVLFLILMAIGIAPFHPLATALVGESAHPDHRTFQIGVFETTGALGIVLASLTFGRFAGLWGWRQTCLLLALPGFPLAWYYLKMKEEVIDELAEPEEKVAIFYIILFILTRGIRGLGLGGIMNFLPTLGTDQLGVSGGTASWLMTALFLGSMIGSLGGGWIADRNRPLLVVWGSTLIMIPVIMGMTYSGNFLFVLMMSAVFGAMNGGFFASQNSWLTTASTAATRGRVMGTAFLIDGISVTVAPTIFGWLADYMGLLSSLRWTMLPIALSAALFLKIYHLQLQDKLASRKVA